MKSSRLSWWVPLVMALVAGCGGTSSGPVDPGWLDGAGGDVPEPRDLEDLGGGDGAPEAGTDLPGAEDGAKDPGPGDVGVDDPGSGPLDLSSWCERWSDAWCGFQVRCGWRAPGSEGSCRASLVAECPGAWLPTLEGQGGISFDAPAGAACLEALSSMDCGEWWAAFREGREPVPSCGKTLSGRRTAGDPCSWTLECPPEAWCDLTTCPGTCRNFAALGDPCDLDRPCDPLWALCRAGTCTALPWVGEPCLEGFCRAPATCDGGTCRVAGTPGEPCVSDQTCLAGLVCIAEGAGPGRCDVPRGPGSPCFRSAECGDPQGRLPLVCASGRCREAPGPGEPCPDLVCRDGWCDSAGEAPICRALPGDGDPCLQGFQCAPGRWCDQGRCIPSRDVGASCEGPWQCASGWCPAGTCRNPGDLPCP